MKAKNKYVARICVEGNFLFVYIRVSIIKYIAAAYNKTGDYMKYEVKV